MRRAVFALLIVGCIPSSPPQAPTIEVEPAKYPTLQETMHCDMKLVIAQVTSECCPKACSVSGKYDHDMHRGCGARIIREARCSAFDLLNTAETSECDCEAEVRKTWGIINQVEEETQ